MNFFQQNLDLIGHFKKKKSICTSQKIFIFFSLKKKEMAQGRVPSANLRRMRFEDTDRGTRFRTPLICL